MNAVNDFKIKNYECLYLQLKIFIDLLTQKVLPRPIQADHITYLVVVYTLQIIVKN